MSYKIKAFKTLKWLRRGISISYPRVHMLSGRFSYYIKC